MLSNHTREIRIVPVNIFVLHIQHTNTSNVETNLNLGLKTALRTQALVILYNRPLTVHDMNPNMVWCYSFKSCCCIDFEIYAGFVAVTTKYNWQFMRWVIRRTVLLPCQNKGCLVDRYLIMERGGKYSLSDNNCSFVSTEKYSTDCTFSKGIVCKRFL